METIHFSDWGSQPNIRIACTQEYHTPWKIRTDLPENIHEIPIKDQESILYTFETKMVTCDKCRELDSFKESKKYYDNYQKLIEKIGLTEKEFLELPFDEYKNLMKIFKDNE